MKQFIEDAVGFCPTSQTIPTGSYVQFTVSNSNSGGFNVSLVGIGKRNDAFLPKRHVPANVLSALENSSPEDIFLGLTIPNNKNGNKNTILTLKRPLLTMTESQLVKNMAEPPVLSYGRIAKNSLGFACQEKKTMMQSKTGVRFDIFCPTGQGDSHLLEKMIYEYGFKSEFYTKIFSMKTASPFDKANAKNELETCIEQLSYLSELTSESRLDTLCFRFHQNARLSLNNLSKATPQHRRRGKQRQQLPTCSLVAITPNGGLAAKTFKFSRTSYLRCVSCTPITLNNLKEALLGSRTTTP